MTEKELRKMFKGYEKYVMLEDDSVLVLDFKGFDKNWNEIYVDVPDVVYERAAACNLMGVSVHYESEDI